MDSEYLALAKKIAKEKMSPLIASDGSGLAYRTLIMDASDKQLVLRNNVPFEDIISFTNGKFYTLNLGKVVLKASHILSDGTHLIFPLAEVSWVPSDLNLQNNGKMHYECCFINPIDGHTALKKPIIAMSEQRVCIKNYRNSMLLQLGLAIPDLRIENKEKVLRSGTGRVVANTEVLGLRGQLRQEVLIEWTNSSE